MEILNETIQNTLNSFDWSFCISVNVLTYIIVKTFKKRLSTWMKRIIMLFVVLLIGVVEYFLGMDIKCLINSAILAPVSWSWIFKPLCEKFNINYKKEEAICQKEEEE